MTASHIDPKAAALLQPMLDDGETLLWAERPDYRGMFLKSLRLIAMMPMNLIAAGILAVLAVTAALRDPADVGAYEGFNIVLAALAAGSVIQLVYCCVLLPLFALATMLATAYGATRSYVFVRRGLAPARLIRTPVSLIEDIVPQRTHGFDAIVFLNKDKVPSPFAILHAKNPGQTVTTLKPLLLG